MTFTDPSATSGSTQKVVHAEESKFEIDCLQKNHSKNKTNAISWGIKLLLYKISLPAAS